MRPTKWAVRRSGYAAERWRTRDEHERGGHAPLEQACQDDGDGREQQRVVAAVRYGAPVVVICAAQASPAVMAVCTSRNTLHTLTEQGLLQPVVGMLLAATLQSQRLACCD